MKIHITRKRYVIIRDGRDIFCGLARNFQFKQIQELGDTAVKTYLSRKKAIAAFNASWREDYDDSRYKVVEVTESIQTDKGNHAHVVVNWLGDCHCSNCGENIDSTSNYCNWCGAKLDEPEQRED